MKSTLFDRSALAALTPAVAADALLAHNDKCHLSYDYGDEGDADGLAQSALNFDALIKQHPAVDETCDGMVQAFHMAFAFGLELGARIGADPYHVPMVADLVTKCRFIPEKNAA